MKTEYSMYLRSKRTSPKRYVHMRPEEIATLRTLRYEGLSLYAIARIMGRPATTLSRWVNQPGPRMRAKLNQTPPKTQSTLHIIDDILAESSALKSPDI